MLRFFLCLLALTPARFAWGAPDTARNLVIVGGHGRYVGALACSPDGTLLATGDEGGTVKVWARATRTLLLSFGLGAQGVKGLKFDPSGRLVLVMGEGVSGVWNIETGRELWRRPQTFRIGQWSKDGRFVRGVGLDLTRQTLDALTGRLEQQEPPVQGDDSSRNAVALSLDGHWLASTALAPPADGSPAQNSTRGVIYQTLPLALRTRLKIAGDRFGPGPLAFSPDGQLLAVATPDFAPQNGSRALFRLVRVPDGQLVRSTVAFRGSGSNTRFEALAFSPDGRLIAASGEDDEGSRSAKSVKVWNVESGELVRVWRDSARDTHQALAFSHSAWDFASPTKLLVAVWGRSRSGSDFGVRELDIATGESTVWFPPRPTSLGNAGWSPDGRMLFATEQRSARDELATLPTDTPLLDTFNAPVLRFWSRDTGKLIAPPWGLQPTITVRTAREKFGDQWAYSTTLSASPGADIARGVFSPNGTLFVALRPSLAHRLEAWRWPSGPRLRAYTAPPRPRFDPTFSPAQSARFEEEVRALDESPRTLRGQVKALDMSPDQRTVALGTINSKLMFASVSDPGPDGQLALWDAQSGEFVQLDGSSDASWLAFSPGGRFVAAQLSPRAANAPADPAPARSSPRGASRLEIWEVATRRRVASTLVPDSSVFTAALGWKNERELLVRTFDRVERWDFARNTRTPLPLDLAAFRTQSTAGDNEPQLSVDNRFLRVRGAVLCSWFALDDGHLVGSMRVEGPTWQSPPTIAPDGKLAAWERPGGLELWTLHPQRSGQLAATLAVFPSSELGQAPDWLAWTPDGWSDGTPGAAKHLAWREGASVRALQPTDLVPRPGLLAQLGRPELSAVP